MVFFITFIRAIAAVIITNSHYTGVYPTDLIANGGLLGDVLFFAVSGYCMANIKLPFQRWYLKRILRIYPPVLIITGVYVILGFYECNDVLAAVKLFIYPTYYHFVASILFLYIPFYIVMKIGFLSKRLPVVILGTVVLQLLVYVLFFDKSTYHADNVHDYFIRFLFFIAMLIGAYIRKNDIKYRNKIKKLNIIFMIALFPIYFVSKLAFTKFNVISEFQIINQYILLALLYFVFATVAGFDSKLEKLPNKLKKVIEIIGNHTLEIYLVQYVIIPKANILVFPINWIIITACIAASAIALRFVSQKIIGLIDKYKKVY